MKRKICVVTGSRADFGIVYSVMAAIQAHPELELSTVVTCMHLSPEFGSTVQEVQRHGFPVSARVDMLLSADSNAAMAKSMGIGIYGMAQAFEQLQPDLVLVPADRVEHLAAAATAATMNIPVAHMNGGDVSGSIDESYRHAITKFSHLHFPNCKSSEHRLLAMGERKDRVFLVGDAALDSIHLLKLADRKEIREKYGLPVDPPCLLAIFHAVSSESQTAEDQVGTFLSAVTSLQMPTLFLSPNADAGGRVMVQRLKELAQTSPTIKFVTSVPHADYLSLLKHGNVLVGNSSSGILEAPSFGLPVVNVGSRQNNRERAENVIDVPVAFGAIVGAIKKALTDETFIAQSKACTNPYGEGKAAQKIVEILATLNLTKESTQKIWQQN